MPSKMSLVHFTCSKNVKILTNLENQFIQQTTPLQIYKKKKLKNNY